jgi:hypothetical protein
MSYKQNTKYKIQNTKQGMDMSNKTTVHTNKIVATLILVTC